MLDRPSVFTDDFMKAIAEQTAEILGQRIQAQIQPRLMNTEQAAAYLGMPSAGALRQKIHRGHIPDWVTQKIGGSILYDRVKLDQWLDSGVS